MKSIYRITAAISACMAVLSLASCTSDMKELGDMPEFITGIKVISEDIDLSGLETPDTKVTYSLTSNGSLKFSFSIGDRMGIFPIGGEQVAFPLSKLEADGSAKFDGGAWALRSSYQYAAYFPLNPNKYETQDMNIPVDFRNQTQTGNNSTDGLGASARLFSKASKPDSKGNVTIAMMQSACLVRLLATIPSGTKVSKVILSDNTSALKVAGYVNLETYSLGADEYPGMTNLTSGVITVETTGLTTKTGDNNLTIYLWLPAQDLKGHELQMDIVDSNNQTTTLRTMAAKDPLAGKSMGVNFGRYDRQDLSGGCEAVDMGLSVKWAAYNVGATSIYGIGSYFAWGETTPKDVCTNDNYTYGSRKDTDEIPTAGMSRYTGEVANGDGLYHLLPADDPATVNWGTYWRTPSDAEWRELLNADNCEWTWVSSGSYALVKSKITGNSIRFYAGGEGRNEGICYQGTWGQFWSNEITGYDPGNARCFRFYKELVTVETGSDYRYRGKNVRAVAEY